VAGETQSIDLLAGALAYTCCQVPVLLQKASETYIEVHTADGEVVSLIGDVLETAYSQHIFQRDGLVHHVCVHHKLIPNQ
jgi:hypothetical protein